MLGALAVGCSGLCSVLWYFLWGCVERSVTLVSDPPGSLVYLNDVQQGTTPCTVPFKWYGDYSVRLRKTQNIGTPLKPKYVYYYLHTHKNMPRPWFQWYGVDLFASILPIEFKDHQIWAFVAPKVPQLSTQVLIEKANALKVKLPPANRRVHNFPTCKRG